MTAIKRSPTGTPTPAPMAALFVLLPLFSEAGGEELAARVEVVVEGVGVAGVVAWDVDVEDEDEEEEEEVLV